MASRSQLSPFIILALFPFLKGFIAENEKNLKISSYYFFQQ